ncbi:MAG: conserved exported protein of unknown function [Methanothrix sp.]|jgi:hypothetical protein|nr:MAG: conserved exported protein of unknown function [Methanothrix sp.]
MKRVLISTFLIISLMGSAAAFDLKEGMLIRPGEAAAEKRFEQGFARPWVGGDPPFRSSSHETYPRLYSIYRPGFPFEEPPFWAGGQFQTFRHPHPFSHQFRFSSPRMIFSG